MDSVIVRPQEQVTKQLSHGSSETGDAREGAGPCARLGCLSPTLCECCPNRLQRLR